MESHKLSHTHIHTHTHTRTHAHTHIHTHTCTHMHPHTCTHVHTHAHTPHTLHTLHTHTHTIVIHDLCSQLCIGRVHFPPKHFVECPHPCQNDVRVFTWITCWPRRSRYAPIPMVRQVTCRTGRIHTQIMWQSQLLLV